MYLTRYEPLNRLGKMHRELDRFFGNDAYKQDDEVNAFLSSQWLPAVDIKEEENRYILRADIPGVDTKSVDVMLENDVLTIQGSKETEIKEEGDKYQRIERLSGQFIRRFSLPNTVSTEDVQATANHGVLEVIIPKVKKAQTRKIEVK